MPGLFSSMPGDIAQMLIDDWLSPEPLGKYFMAVIANKNLRESGEIKEILLLLSQHTNETAIRSQARFPMLFSALPEKMQQAFLADTDFVSRLKNNLKNWGPTHQFQASIMEGILDKRTLRFDQHIPGIMDAIIQADPNGYSDSQELGIRSLTIQQDQDIQDRLFGSVYFFSSAEWDNFADRITVILNSQSNLEIKSKAIRALAFTLPFIKNKNKIAPLVSALLTFMWNYAMRLHKKYRYRPEDIEREANINQLLDQAFPHLKNQMSFIISWLQEVLLKGSTHFVLASLKTLLKHDQFKEAILNNTFFKCVLDQVVEAENDGDDRADKRSLNAIAIMNLIFSSVPKSQFKHPAIRHLASLIIRVYHDTPNNSQLALNAAIFEFFSQSSQVLSETEHNNLYEVIGEQIASTLLNRSLFAMQFLFMSIKFSRNIHSKKSDNFQKIIDELTQECIKKDYLTVTTILKTLLKNSVFRHYFMESWLFSHLIEKISALEHAVIAKKNLSEFEQLLEILKILIPNVTQATINNKILIGTFCVVLKNLAPQQAGNDIVDKLIENIINLIIGILNQLAPLFNSTIKLMIFRELSNNIRDRHFNSGNSKIGILLKQLATTIAKQDAPELCRDALKALEEFEALAHDAKGAFPLKCLGFHALPRHAMQGFFEEKKLLQRLWLIFDIADNDNHLFSTRQDALILLCSCLPLYITNDATQIQRIFAAAENNYPELHPDWIPPILEELRTSFENFSFYSADLVTEIVEQHQFFDYVTLLLENTLWHYDYIIHHYALKLLYALACLKPAYFLQAMINNTKLIHAIMFQMTCREYEGCRNHPIAIDLLTQLIKQGLDLRPYLADWQPQSGKIKEWNTLSLLQEAHDLNKQTALSTANASLFGVSSGTKKLPNNLAKQITI